MPFFTRSHRLRLWRRDYIRAQDGLTLAAAILTGILATVTYSTHPQLTAILGTLYTMVVAGIVVITIRNRRAKDQIQGEVLWGLFALINKEVFKADHRTRFTLFRQDSFQRDYITPWYRYFKGGLGPIEEASRSKARYRRGEGMTGKAWAEAGRSLLLVGFPHFASREEFEAHYVNKLGISKDTVRDLTDHMMKVRTMFCYAFVGHGDRTLGVLSLDFEAPLVIQPRPSFPSPDDSHPILIDNSQLQLLLRSVHNVLESFAKSERRFL